jgi:hypothetical protein
LLKGGETLTLRPCGSSALHKKTNKYLYLIESRVVERGKEKWKENKLSPSQQEKKKKEHKHKIMQTDAQKEQIQKLREFNRTVRNKMKELSVKFTKLQTGDEHTGPARPDTIYVKRHLNDDGISIIGGEHESVMTHPDPTQQARAMVASGHIREVIYHGGHKQTRNCIEKIKPLALLKKKRKR